MVYRQRRGNGWDNPIGGGFLEHYFAGIAREHNHRDDMMAAAQAIVAARLIAVAGLRGRAG
jgi:hypothetical protein